METARRVMQHYFPDHFLYWLTIKEAIGMDYHLDCEKSIYPNTIAKSRELLSMSHNIVREKVYNPGFSPIAPYGHKSKYFRNMCLSVASVAFPEEFDLVFVRVPEFLGKTSLMITLGINPNPAVVQVLNLKMQIAAEKAEVKRLTAEHKATLKYLKIKQSDESIPLPE